MQIAATVSVIQEARQAIVAALDDMLGNACEVEARLSCHRSSMATGGVARQRPWPLSAVGMSRFRVSEVNLTPFC
jgi:hypothetical protein